MGFQTQTSCQTSFELEAFLNVMSIVRKSTGMTAWKYQNKFEKTLCEYVDYYEGRSLLLYL